MRILLTSNASHVPPRGGSTRSNLVWLEYLESRGHDCRIVAPALSRDTPQRATRIETELDQQRIRVHHLKTDPKLGFEVLEKDRITVYSVADPARLRPVLRQKILKYEPDWVLVSSEDLGQGLLQEAHQAAPGRVIYLAHTPQMFPFGPASLNPNANGKDLVARSAAIIAIGQHTASYIEKYVGRRPAIIHPPVYGPGPYVRRDPTAPGLITLINASAVKGIDIFLALARRFPGFAFGALHGWGTTEDDFRALKELPNIELLAKVKHIESVLDRTKILLVPSLWPEGFGLVVMQAMLMGVPVLASNLGSLVEAKAGTRYVLPVCPIERYRTVFDENRMPVPVIPQQSIEPWADALQELMTNQKVYISESDAARDAAMSFVSSVRPSQFEDFLLSLQPSAPKTEAQPVIDERPPHNPMQQLSPQRRALLLRKVQEKARRQP